VESDFTSTLIEQGILGLWCMFMIFLYVLARTLHDRTLQLLITCQNQHMGIKDNCEVEVERRLSYTHAPDDEPPPF